MTGHFPLECSSPSDFKTSHSSTPCTVSTVQYSLHDHLFPWFPLFPLMLRFSHVSLPDGCTVSLSPILRRHLAHGENCATALPLSLILSSSKFHDSTTTESSPSFSIFLSALFLFLFVLCGRAGGRVTSSVRIGRALAISRATMEDERKIWRLSLLPTTTESIICYSKRNARDAKLSIIPPSVPPFDTAAKATFGFHPYQLTIHEPNEEFQHRHEMMRCTEGSSTTTDVCPIWR